MEDLRKSTSSMEDSTTMTIEFLRARLLSERSVSRTTKQRADELAKRVVELEQQLRVVSLQRKKAEKATADVLAILENHGVSDVSETFDSSSDQEATPRGSRTDKNLVGEKKFASDKGRRNDMEAFSGSELETSPLIGRSLSWKSGKDSQRSIEKKKYMNSSRRRRSGSFASTDSFSPKRVGKSCRQIRCRETRSAVEELQNDAGLLACQDSGTITSSEGFPNQSEIGPVNSRESSENRDEKVRENQTGVTSSNYSKGHGRDEGMERALEHQAQLISRYETEEKAQREWEEKFIENNNCTPDSCDPGNHSDVTEERDDIKVPTPACPGDTITSQNQDARSESAEVCSSEEPRTPIVFGVPPHVDVGCLQDQKCSSMITSTSEFAFPVAKGKHDQQFSENHHALPGLHSHSFSGYYSADVSEPHAASSLYTGNALGSGNELALMPHETSDKLGSVLGALQQAKLSLKQKLERPPLIERGSVGMAVSPSVPTLKSSDRLDIPFGFAGLFSVPSDFELEATPQANHMGLGSRQSLTNYYPETGLATTASERLFTGGYMQSRASYSTNDQFLTIPSSHYTQIRSGALTRTPVLEPRFDVEMRPGVPTITSVFEPGLGAGPVSSSRYLDPHLSTGFLSGNYSYPTYPIWPDPMSQMPSIEGLSRTLPSNEVGMPSASHFPFYDDHITQNMYR